MRETRRSNEQMALRIARPQLKALEAPAKRDVVRALGEILLAVAEMRRRKEETRNEAD